MQNAFFHCVSLLTLKKRRGLCFPLVASLDVDTSATFRAGLPHSKMSKERGPRPRPQLTGAPVNLFSYDRVVLVTISMLRSSQRAQRLQTVLQSGPSAGEARPVETRALAVSAIIWR